MFPRISALTGLRTLLSAVCVFLAAGSAAAQQGARLYEWSGGWGRYSQPAPGPVYPYPPFGSTVTPSTQAPTTEAFYPGTEQTPPANEAVTFNIAVPADAQIWFGTSKMTQGGAYRQFVSPPIARGYDYAYKVTATWKEGGKNITRTRDITVHAGDVINLTFGSGE
jgi:uncharacterized protein (TIGR03000 family)